MCAKRLLCVDDDASTLQVRKSLLEACGYSVLTASSGEDALTLMARGADVDLVLLDYLMPAMNGDELARKLRQQYPFLPLVAVSAVGQLPLTLLQHVDASVQKGQDPEVLLATVSTSLDRSRKEDAIMAAPEKKTVLCVEDEKMQRDMLRALFESAAYQVVEARNAGAALEAFKASHVDAVVMDYWLSGNSNGTALAEEMKRLRPGIPIVMLSGFPAMPGEWSVVDSWMRKAEVEPERLLNEVERLIQRHALSPQAEQVK